jgi:hypothetical protein
LQECFAHKRAGAVLFYSPVSDDNPTSLPVKIFEMGKACQDNSGNPVRSPSI